MPAILKTVYSIGPGVDLSSTDPVTAVIDSMQLEHGESVAKNITDNITKAVTDGITRWDLGRNTLNRTNKTFIIERQYNSLEAATAQKTWLESNVPSSTSNFTRDSIVVTDNVELPEYGPILI